MSVYRTPWLRVAAVLSLLSPLLTLDRSAGADIRWQGGQLRVVSLARAGAGPAALGVYGPGADALVGWVDGGAAMAARLGPVVGVGTPERLDGATAPVAQLRLARMPGGAAVASWVDGAMWARRLLPDGTLAPIVGLGDDVPATAAGATIAPEADGSYLAAYLRRVVEDGGGVWWDSVALRRFGRGGRPLGPSREVSPRFANCSIATFCGTSTPATPRLARGTSSSLVVWEASFRAGAPTFFSGSGDLHGLILDRSGAPVGDDFLINDYRDAGMSESAVAALPDGGFVVTWVAAPNLNTVGDRTRPQDGAGAAIVARVLGDDGSPRGPEVVVNSITAGDQRQPAVTVTAEGAITVVWRSGADRIAGQVLAADLSRIGGEWTVNTTGPEVATPSIATESGGWLVAWERRHYGLDGQVVSTIESQRLALWESDDLVVDAPEVMTLAEGGAPRDVAVHLRTMPSAPVTVPIASSDPAVVRVEPTALTFTSADWDLPQTIQVRGLDDGLAAGDRGAAVVFGPLASDDLSLAGQTPSALRVAVHEPSCRLQVFEPQADLRVTVGQLAPVGWLESGEVCGGRVSLQLLREGAVVADLGTKPNLPDGAGAVSTEVRIPAAMPPGGGYQLRVSTLGSPAWFGDSPRFELRPRVCRLTLTSPNGGERWAQGSARTVTWTASGPGCGGAGVELALLRGSTAVRVIASDTANDGSFAWTVPEDQPRGANYRVDVALHGRPEVHDRSDRVFLIVGAP